MAVEDADDDDGDEAEEAGEEVNESRTRSCNRERGWRRIGRGGSSRRRDR